MTNTEKTVEQQVTEALESGIQALQITQQQSSQVENLDVSNIVSMAMSTSGGQAAKTAAFFPALDARAKDVLAVIGGTEDVFVVPNGISMQSQNKAITMKSGDQVETYRGHVETEALRRQDVDVAAARNRVTENIILVKEELFSTPELEMYGTIWHEHGHVLYEAPETGNVFAHELLMIHQHRTGDLKAWIAGTRPLRYLARYASDPGLDALESVIEAILPDEYEKYKQLRYNVVNKVAVEKKEAVVTTLNFQVGNAIEGTIDDIRQKLVLSADVNITLEKGQEVTLAGHTWKVEAYYPDEGESPDSAYDTYKLRCLKVPEVTT